MQIRFIFLEEHILITPHKYSFFRDQTEPASWVPHVGMTFSSSGNFGSSLEVGHDLMLGRDLRTRVR
jgi:hypothetical protein